MKKSYEPNSRSKTQSVGFAGVKLNVQNRFTQEAMT